VNFGKLRFSAIPENLPIMESKNREKRSFCRENRAKREKSAICSLLQSKPRENGLFCGKMQLVRRKSACLRNS